MHPQLEALICKPGKFTPIRRISAFGLWGQSPHPNATTVTINMDGIHETKQESGNGPVNATFNAVMAACQIVGTLENYAVDTKRGVGASGVGRVTIWLKHKDQIYKATTNDSNVDLAVVDACLSAVNNMLRAKRKLHRDAARRSCLGRVA